MNIVLTAINAKYIHSNLAVYCLKSYAASKGQETEIAEYTINQQTGEVLRELDERNADVVAFSCYIWNIDYIKPLCQKLKENNPNIIISKIAHGVPLGANMDYIDSLTLEMALANRTKVSNS